MARTVWHPRTRLHLVGAVPVLVVLVFAHGLLVDRYPKMDLALAALFVFACFPAVCRAVLIGAVAIGPTFNPAVLGLGAAAGGGVGGGRIYAVQAVLVLLVVGASVLAARNGLHGTAAIVVGLTVLLVAVQTVGRPHAGPAWIYRPFQLFLVAFAVRALFAHCDHRPLLLALAWGSAIGCALASAHALVPTIDPFAASRPDNVPYVSAIGNFARATGAFTYPNNLGTFAAYTTLLGCCAWLLGRPVLPRRLAAALMVSGGSALVLSGSRAAGLGLVCGLLYLTFKAAPRRRAVLLLAETVAGLVLVTAVLTSPTALEVAQQRLDTATGASLTIRVEGWRGDLRALRASPFLGTGATESRTDNFWLLYLSQGGVIGAVLYVALARHALRPARGPGVYPALWMAVSLALCTSGLLQDSLGQTLTTWFPGVLLGLSALSEPVRERSLVSAPAGPDPEGQTAPGPERQLGPGPPPTR